MESKLIIEGSQIAAVGIFTVLFFLSMLVGVVKLMSHIVYKYQTLRNHTKETHDIKKRAAIFVALHTHKKNSYLSGNHE